MNYSFSVLLSNGEAVTISTVRWFSFVLMIQTAMREKLAVSLKALILRFWQYHKVIIRIEYPELRYQQVSWLLYHFRKTFDHSGMPEYDPSLVADGKKTFPRMVT